MSKKKVYDHSKWIPLPPDEEEPIDLPDTPDQPPTDEGIDDGPEPTTEVDPSQTNRGKKAPSHGEMSKFKSDEDFKGPMGVDLDEVDTKPASQVRAKSDPETVERYAECLKDLGPIPVEVGTQTETGFPHAGKIDYIAPDLDQGTGTLPVTF